jgi:molybdopterin synthase catalytic subunit
VTVADDIRVVCEAFDPGLELERFRGGQRMAGGIVSFLGQVREDGDVEVLELSHYAPLTMRGMEELAKTAKARWSLLGLLAMHRVGAMLPGEAIVLVAAAARHRRDAFAAADFMMDHLKSDAWFWKRERRGGQWHWIEPRVQDYQDRERWGIT